jgi:alpha-mannosidase
VNSDTVAKPPGKVWDLNSKPSSIEICENGPVRAIVRIKRSFHNSNFTQDIILYSDIDRVDFDLTLDWHDIHWMIKLAFPMNVENAEVTYDSAYGVAVRPADGLECSVQKWVDLSSPDYGVAFLNNGRNGNDVEGNVARLSILRSPTTPAYNVEEGIHCIGYSIYPHSGTWRSADVVQKGYEFNQPLIASLGNNHQGKLPSCFSFLKVEPENVVVEVLKKAYDTDDLVIRFYETLGKSCTAVLTMPSDISSACEIDLLENEIGKVGFSGNILKASLGAYEIKTIKFMLKQ